MQLLALFKCYKRSMSIQRGQKEFIMVNDKFLILQHNLLGLVSIHPFLNSLTDKIEEAFSVPEQLKGFISIDPATFPQKAKDLTDSGGQKIISIADFHSQKEKLDSVVITCKSTKMFYLLKQSI